VLLQIDVRENHRMDNPETLATLGTQDTGRRLTNTTQKPKSMIYTDPTKKRGGPKCSRALSKPFHSIDKLKHFNI